MKIALLINTSQFSACNCDRNKHIVWLGISESETVVGCVHQVIREGVNCHSQLLGGEPLQGNLFALAEEKKN